MIFLVIFLVNLTRTIKFDISYLIIMGPMIRCLSNLMFTLLLKGNLSARAATFFYVLTSTMTFQGLSIPLCLVWSTSSKRLVDGFETTGVAVCVFSILNLGVFLNSLICEDLVDWFEVKLGYLERLDGYFILTISVQILLCLVSFLFFWVKEPSASIRSKLHSK